MSKIKRDGGSLSGRSYYLYRASLTQSGASNPVATVIENSIPTTMTWTRSSQGNFLCTSGTSIFDANTTVGNSTISSSTFNAFSLLGYASSSTMLLIITDDSTPRDGFTAFVEILVYI